MRVPSPFSDQHSSRQVGSSADPLWYKDAVIYELRVRSFFDGNGDGIGDLPGLTSKLDYLQDLGVTALWILPFYPSPGKDDGYDIADYTDVNPEYGRLEDFRAFLEGAHARGLKVITELVINHTSDQHPWFQRARRASPGSSLRDFYVWSDTPERYREARIIFKDFEPSNWAWDPIAKAYYWHRFFSHQPDLNFRNPEVQQAVLSVCDFWLDLGVDGMRLDAIPYLYEEDGTNCENLPETHAFLKQLRAHIDSKYENRMLLAEANQWPEDAAAYFGNGDECNMNFHFPIMPRIFMSIHMEDRLPIVDILAQTPPIPENCQWAVFLRNHDELTLEMVTDEERDYMYRAFAHDPTMRINLGIRRRLAPLLQNDRPNIELMNGLLFSLPGTPVLYYGDELGMGDNVYLGDRNGVRTPMQWSADRNAGFSRANPQKLMLPVIIDPEYHYESINVEAQQNNPHSLLWWTKRLVALRKHSQVFGRGSLEVLQPDNPRVLAFLRQYQDQTVLVVANLSRNVQYVELALGKYKGLVPVELFGGTKLPPIGELPYLLTLSGHAFYWLSLERTDVTARIAKAAAYQPIALTLDGAPEEIFAARQHDSLAAVCSNYLASQHWFHADGREVEQVTLLDVTDVPGDLRMAALGLRYANDETEVYVLPLALRSGAAAEDVRVHTPGAVLANLRSAAGSPASHADAVLIDAAANPAASQSLLQLLAAPQRIRSPGGELIVEQLSPLPAPAATLEPRQPKLAHETARMVFGEQLMLKLPYRVEEGIPPDLELTRFLTAHQQSAPSSTVPLVSVLNFKPRNGALRSVAKLHGFFAHDTNAWALTTGELSRFFERVLSRPREEPVPVVLPKFLFNLQPVDPSPGTAELVGLFQGIAKGLAQRVAELHRALASEPADPDFAPEPYSVLDQRATYQSLRNLAGNVLRRLRLDVPRLPERLQPPARQLLEHSSDLYQAFQPLLGSRLSAKRVRIHGELDLHHLLYNGKDFAIIDFDGDRRRPLIERRRKRSPLRDVATLVASLHRATYHVLGDDAVVRSPDRERAEPWAHLWFVTIASILLRDYETLVAGAPFMPVEPAPPSGESGKAATGQTELPLLLRCFLVENGLAELGEELATPSAQAEAPLRLLLELLGSE